jgi:HK97 gp10 family phage protein
VSVTVKTNLPDFRLQLREVDRKTRTKVVRAALRAAANVFKRHVKREAPKRSGALQRAIYVSRGRGYKAATDERFFVAVRTGKKYAKKGKGDPFYWGFLEAGWIPRGRGQALKGGDRSKALQRRRLLASGAKKVQFPFFAPAFKSGGTEALTAFNTRMDRDFTSLFRR